MELFKPLEYTVLFIICLNFCIMFFFSPVSAGVLREAESSRKGAEGGRQPEENGHAGVCGGERKSNGAAVTQTASDSTAAGQRGGARFTQSEGGGASTGCAQS